MAKNSINRPEPNWNDLPVLPHPNLVLDRGEIAALRRKRKDPVAEELFQATRAEAESWMDPTSRQFIDYEKRRDPIWKTRGGLNKVFPVETLAFLYAMTGERRYADFAHEIVFTVIRKKLADRASDLIEAPGDKTIRYGGWRHNASHDFGRFSFVLAIYYDFCRGLLTAKERREFVRYAEECLALHREMWSEIGRMSLHNHGARASIGNAVLALAIQGEHRNQWLWERTMFQATYDAEAYAHFSIDSDGAPAEGASYAANTVTWLAMYGRILARRGLRDFSYYPNLQLYPTYILYTLRPDGSGPIPINDCHMDCPIHPLLAITCRTQDRVARWLWQEMREKIEEYLRLSRERTMRTWQGFSAPMVEFGYGSPTSPYQNFLFYDPRVKPLSPVRARYPLARHFRDHGVVAMLSGWGAGDVKATFFCGEQQLNVHRQDDQNTFTFCALGEKFAWDGAYGPYGLYENRRYRNTDVHNGMLIDGRGENGYNGRRYPRGRIAEFRHCGDWTYALGDARRCYGINGVIARADRHLLFRRGKFPYLLVVDDIEADGVEHDYTFNLVSNPGNAFERVKAGEIAVKGQRAEMRLLSRASRRLSVRQDMAGELPRLQLTQRARRANFATLLLPVAKGLKSWAMSAAFKRNSAMITVTLNGRTERIVLDLRDRTGLRVGDERVEISVT